MHGPMHSSVREQSMPEAGGSTAADLEQLVQDGGVGALHKVLVALQDQLDLAVVAGGLLDEVHDVLRELSLQDCPSLRNLQVFCAWGMLHACFQPSAAGHHSGLGILHNQQPCGRP